MTDDRVFIIGGVEGDLAALASAEVFDPEIEEFDSVS